MAHISPIAPKLHGYQTYATFDDTSNEHGVIDPEISMPMKLHFAICKFLCPEIVFIKLPHRPPNGLITSSLAKALISSIFTMITIHSCYCICIHWLSQIKVTKAILRETFCNGSLILRKMSLRVTPILREYTWISTWKSSFKATQTMLHGFTTLSFSILTQAFASEMIPFNTDSSF